MTKEEYLKKMEVDGTLYIGEFSNEHGEVFYVHFPLKQNTQVANLIPGGDTLFFQIGGTETDWQTLPVVGSKMIVDGGNFIFNDDERKRMRSLIMSKKGDVIEFFIRDVINGAFNDFTSK